MPTYQLTPEQEPLDHDTRQPELWASLIAFIIINNLSIFARIWIKWGTNLNRKRVTAEDIFVRNITSPDQASRGSHLLRLPLKFGEDLLTVDGHQKIILSGVSRLPLNFHLRCEIYQPNNTARYLSMQ